MTKYQERDAEPDSSSEFECPICGQKVYHELLVCPKCGLRFYPEDEEEQPAPDRSAQFMKIRADQTAHITGSETAVPAASSNAYRRKYGLLMGLGLGLLYGLVSQTINLILIPGVPLYQPPFGPVGNILLAALLGCVLGLANAWFEAGATGVILSSAIGAVVMLIGSILGGNVEQSKIWAALFASLLILLPLAGATALVMIALRWITNRGTAAYEDGQSGDTRPSWTRFALPAAALALAFALGLTAMVPPDGRAVTPRMHALIQQGQQAGSQSELPAPLRSTNVKAFIQFSHAPYTLQWDRDEKNTFAIPRPASSLASQSTVIARFENGYLLACVFPGAKGDPECKDFPSKTRGEYGRSDPHHIFTAWSLARR